VNRFDKRNRRAALPDAKMIHWGDMDPPQANVQFRSQLDDDQSATLVVRKEVKKEFYSMPDGCTIDLFFDANRERFKSKEELEAKLRASLRLDEKRGDDLWREVLDKVISRKPDLRGGEDATVKLVETWLSATMSEKTESETVIVMNGKRH